MPTRVALSMKRRLMIPLPLPIPLGMRIAEVSTGFAIFGAIVDAGDGGLSVAAAVISVGAVLVPRLIEWYRSFAAAKRAEHAADVRQDKDILSEEVRRRVELEAECKSLRAEVAENRHKLRGQEQTIENLTAQLERLRQNLTVLDSKVSAITPADGTPAPPPAAIA